MAKNISKNTRKSANLLPAFFRTDKNNKFLSSTLDQLIKVPSLERIDGYVGSKLSKNYNPLTDTYISETLPLREKYQLQPALVLKNLDQSIKAAYGFDDLVNQVNYYGGNVDNLDRLFRPKFLSYDPRIDWDKFINFRDYYWLPNGPSAVLVAGLQENAVSTYTVTDSADKNFLVFTPDGLTPDPLLTFYRGMTYVFNVDSVHTVYFKTEPVDGTGSVYNHGVTGNGTKKGQIIVTVDNQTPNVLFYAAADNQLASGRILIKSIVENSSIDVNKEIVGKSQYKSGNGVEFINGMKIRFVGDVTPISYVDKDYIVEGVGDKIRLVDFSKLATPLNLNPTIDPDFDQTPFDEYPFDDFRNLPETPEYITINRASKDLNPWTRYNRWTHKDVVAASATANGVTPEYSYDQQAKRPIIKFRPDMQLWNFGTTAIDVVDYIDDITTDAFSTVEGSFGYYIDGIRIEDGNRVIFNADPDPLVQGKVYQVNISIYQGEQKIRLTEIVSPVNGDSVVIRLGNNFGGTSWWFDGTRWINGQQRTGLNQPPLFDLFDNTGNSYSDSAYYDSDFLGNKIFGYSIGTGIDDPVLGFPLQYISESISSVGSYLFTNYLNTESIIIVGDDIPAPTYKAYLRINHTTDTFEYINSWTEGAEYLIPVEQFQVVTTQTSDIEVTVFDNPTTISDLRIDVFVDDIKQLQGTDFTLTSINKTLKVTFISPLPASITDPIRVLLRCYSSATPNKTGTYATPINITNNPLNGFIANFTLSELADHVQTMIDRDPEYKILADGSNNLKSLPAISKYGTRLISNKNPLSFAQLFVTDPEHNLINAARKAATDYYQFKLNLIKFISQTDGETVSNQILDHALVAMNKNKNSTFLYAQSDMLGYGDNNITSVYTVTDARNKEYSISSVYSPTTLSNRAVLVYRTSNGATTQLVYGKDYSFSLYDPNVRIISSINKGDTITIKDYVSTIGTYIPPTPTKLGLYPKYQPEIYVDTSYAGEPQKVIQGHDGSLTVAFSKPGEADDYRDLALLEYETRVYNNLKVTYDTNLVNIYDILPSVFRTTEYNYDEVYNLVHGDFLKWTSVYGLDFSTNSTYDVNNHKTYNYRSADDLVFGTELPGNWRAIYKLYFDTDRPNTHPWEMLGFSIKPSWWESEYGAAPYTAGNLNLWQDLEAGLIRQGERAGVDPTFVRTGLSQVIPVDDSGNIIDIREWAGIALNESIINTNQDWRFGDHGPVETAWRRSSLWPFAMQIIMALTKPADYAAMMFDTSRLLKDVTGQYNYGSDELFLNPKNLFIFSDVDSAGNPVLATGYSVWVIENGRQRSTTYVDSLKADIASVDFNLFYKAGGFISKDKLDIIIDSISPNTANPGVLLPNEDYNLHFNISPPVKSAAISGIIVEKNNAQFVVKGYDKRYPYFVINQPKHLANGSSITVGGKSESFLVWKENSFYQAGQVVFYSNVYYRVITSHNSGITFTAINYTPIANLSTVGGASVLTTKQFEAAETIIPYGTRYSTLQEVYDLIVGYGHWLTTQGFVFDDFNKDLGQVVDWNFTGKEFLYWTTQNWANTSVITLSPFADTLQYQFTDAIVDNVLNSFYEYSLLKADGQILPPTSFSLSREDGVCKITTKNPTDGLFFARLNLVQKEHAIIMNNISLFNDTIYDIETGYRQSRIKLTGFRTSEWNGEFLSPGFIYDNAQIDDWAQYTDYQVADVVKYVGNYYSANINIPGTSEFNFTQWNLLGEKPIAQLLPNFDYKINQFEDFYSLDIDNFDAAQQVMAQHLIGYTPRTYLDNIFVNPIAQYKFYQGFIREKGTKNAIDKLAKASIHNLKGRIEFNEEWAFRIGNYGNFTSYNELEFPLREADFRENSQIVKFIDVAPVRPNDVISYITPNDIPIKSDEYVSASVFATKNSTYEENDLLLPIAGYVRTDDVTATAYNRNSLLDIANNGDLQDGNTIWLGFREDGQWDIYRYTIQKPKVLSAEVTIPADTLTFTTDRFHYLTVGEIISINGMTNGTDGVYVVKSIPSLTTFDVTTELSVAEESTAPALMFKFVSVRIDQFDSVARLQSTISFKDGDLVWSDSDTAGKWVVYQKTDNYSTSTEIAPSLIQNGQKYGTRIATSDGAAVVAISAPNYFANLEPAGYGRVFVYQLTDGVLNQDPIVSYTVNDTIDLTAVSTSTQTRLGESLLYDVNADLIYAGAPGADLVKISGINRTLGSEIHLPGALLLNPSDQSGEFGAGLFVTDSTGTTRLMVVGAPAQTGTGVVYAFSLSISTTTLITSSTATIVSLDATVGDRFGEVINGTSDGSKIAISAANANGNQGKVYVYSFTGTTSLTLLQTVDAPTVCKSGDKFGSATAMSTDGTYLLIASENVTDGKSTQGKVFVYKWNTSTFYTLNQTIDNPSADLDLNFGHALSIDNTGKILAVSGKGNNQFQVTTFNDGTTFDNATCNFGETALGSGTAYLFNRYNDKFIYAEELFDKNILNIVDNAPVSGSQYGESIAINNSQVFVGAPGKKTDNNSVGAVYSLTKVDSTLDSWTAYRTQDDLIDLTNVKRAITINAKTQKVIDYVDIIDPAKGHISGLADQELRYKTAFDPAVYSIGTQGVVVDNEASWVEEHLGELWWDLSTVKYTWYEQGDLEYRKNTWGSIFPGASIDVYEWVSSEYLPSQWSSLADTTDGLTKGISGQPKYPDNSVVSVKQYYNSLTSSLTNVYYFWVKNKVTLPNVDTRTISSNDVARLIFNPAAYGVKYVSLLDADAVAVTNITNSLSQNDIYLNIAKDDIENNINRHTEWMLIADGDANSMPNTMLDKKLLDSLLGRDSRGNLVPDPALPERTRYGIGIRPQQGLFKDRTAALRNAIDYANTVFDQYLISDIANFTTLNSKDPIPGAESGEYDQQVSNEEGLADIVTTNLSQAFASCEVTNGRITSVTINTAGYGYLIAPSVEIVDDESGARILTEIDENGKVISATISNPGQNFVTAPIIRVRPYTVIVDSDLNSGGRWATYQWFDNQWNRVHTQNFDTTQVWDYVDWKSTTYDSVKPLVATVEQAYLLDTLTLSTGDYVKVNNQGNGTYIILEKVTSNGTFDDSYNLVYSEKGTIRLKESLWNKTNSSYNFDYLYTFDQTLFDQSAEIELENILFSIKNDIFVGPLKVYWNKFFFKAVRYAMSEQIFLDWAFKTSFINVRNMAGSLDQRPVYKFQNSQYYEDYLNEVKPYHAKIRNFQVVYDVVEPTQSYTTDFDLPAVYDSIDNTFVPIELGNPLLNEYPRKGWADNYKYSIGNISIADGGSGYTSNPSVRIIAATDDVITTPATAIAYISLGKVIEIEVTNPGAGYTITPTVVLTGGGPTDVVQARAYAQLTNNKVRVNKVDIKFDRVSGSREIGLMQASDRFQCNGVNFRFKLSWAAENKKSKIDIKLDGIKVFEVEYSIETYTEVTNGYHKLFSDVVLSYVPENGSILEVTYDKKIDLYHAAERVLDYYNATDGMPGDEIGQLLGGVDYPGTQIQTLPFSYTANWDMLPFTEALWDNDNPELSLDTIFDGGPPLANGGFDLSAATGLNPEDLILDGDAFLSSNVSHGPEELVPGQIAESVGITVYTREPFGSPVIVQSTLNISSTTTSTTAVLGMMPVNTSSVIVSYNNRILDYGRDFTTNISNKTITISTQTVIGLAAITIVGVGGTAFAAYDYVTASNTTTITVSGGIPVENIGSVYVTLNGISLTADQYTLSKKGVTVSGLGTGTNTLQAWFFQSPYKGYSEINEQIITIENEVYDYALTQYPGTVEPINAQAIVELNKRRLTPPNTVYYSASASQLSYDIDPTGRYPLGVYNLDSIQLFRNGNKLRNGFDFILDQPNNKIIFPANVLVDGDAIAITDLIHGEYYFENGRIYLRYYTVPLVGGDTLKVITFTNHDGNLIRTEVFEAGSLRRYVTSRTLFNDDYVWVSVAGNPLINGIDYQLDDDHKTIIIDTHYPMLPTDTVVITSMTDISADTVIAYRMFKDLLGRTTYKRLSKVNSTRLTSPLYTTSTTISVENADVLSKPSPSKNAPGVILIAGERIEYMAVSGNTLSRIRRGTLGTGPKDVYPVNTEVMDQGVRQNLPYREVLNVNATTLTNTSTVMYVVDNMELVLSGNKITTGTLDTVTTLTNQLRVYYGGIPLRKDGVYVHDQTFLYDNVDCNIVGSISTSTNLPVTLVQGTAYLVTATNQVWVYTNSDNVDAVNGFVYQGLTYLPPEYSIETVDTTSTVITLNLPVDRMYNNVRITVIQQQINKDWYASTATSLLDDIGEVATFLRDRQASLPDKYHYGQI